MILSFLLIISIISDKLVNRKTKERNIIYAYGNDIWVVSSGQESIRVWRFDLLQGDEIHAYNDAQLKTQFMLFNEEIKEVINTVHVTLQDILNAHEDWIYSVEWHLTKLQLLSASNDKTLIILGTFRNCC
uniref:Uncharacterized protein n=1 Tax=Onchocerca volvulus TaxID=6282 RepID=A0A8R1Y722_ONCVO